MILRWPTGLYPGHADGERQCRSRYDPACPTSTHGGLNSVPAAGHDGSSNLLLGVLFVNPLRARTFLTPSRVSRGAHPTRCPAQAQFSAPPPRHPRHQVCRAGRRVGGPARPRPRDRRARGAARSRHVRGARRYGVVVSDDGAVDGSGAEGQRTQIRPGRPTSCRPSTREARPRSCWRAARKGPDCRPRPARSGASTSSPGESHGSACSGRVGWGSAPALLVVDLCRAYTDPDGPFALPGAGPAVAENERLLAAARAGDLPVLWTAVRYRPDLADVGWFAAKVLSMRAFAFDATQGWDEMTLPRRPGRTSWSSSTPPASAAPTWRPGRRSRGRHARGHRRLHLRLRASDRHRRHRRRAFGRSSWLGLRRPHRRAAPQQSSPTSTRSTLTSSAWRRRWRDSAADPGRCRPPAAASPVPAAAASSAASAPTCQGKLRVVGAYEPRQPWESPVSRGFPPGTGRPGPKRVRQDGRGGAPGRAGSARRAGR